MMIKLVNIIDLDEGMMQLQFIAMELIPAVQMNIFSIFSII